MYGKIFDSIYDGTLAEDWRALVTFQQLIVLCDADGIVDMTPYTISKRTGIPIEHIEAGLRVLENPDPYSRTPDEDGKRIQLLDPDNRPWGWYIVNHAKYRGYHDADAIRVQNRERKRKQRERERDSLDTSRNVTDCHTSSRHTDTDTDTKQSPSETVEPAGSLPTKSDIETLWAKHLPDNPQIRSWPPTRVKHFRQRLRDMPTLEEWETYFRIIAQSKFLTGQTSGTQDRPPFVANIDWVLKPSNFAKILERTYER